MKKKRIMASFPIRILAVSIPGLLAGLFLNATRTMGLTSGALNLVVTARYVLSQIITFLAPLIIIGLVASSIISVKKAPTPVTAPIVRITYFSMLGAAAFASVLGYLIIPKLPVSTDSLSFRFLPDTLFELPIPAPVSALSALVLAILLALGACWTNAVRTKELLQEFRGITLSLMSRILLPLLPAYIGLSLCTLAYQGYFIKYLPLLLLALIIIIPAYMVWVLVLYHIAGSYAGEKAWGILKNYIPICKMALRTHSSTAVEKYSQEAADKCVPLDSESYQRGNSSFYPDSSLWFCACRGILRYDDLPYSIRLCSCTGNYGDFQYFACHLFHWHTRTSMGNRNGIPGNPYRNPEIRRFRCGADVRCFCTK